MDTKLFANGKNLDNEINRVISEMSMISVETVEYTQAAKNLAVLCEARGVRTNRTISTDVLIAAATNILGIILVLNFERMNVVTSKALSFLMKSK